MFIPNKAEYAAKTEEYNAANRSADAKLSDLRSEKKSLRDRNVSKRFGFVSLASIYADYKLLYPRPRIRHGSTLLLQKLTLCNLSRNKYRLWKLISKKRSLDFGRPNLNSQVRNLMNSSEMPRSRRGVLRRGGRSSIRRSLP